MRFLIILATIVAMSSPSSATTVDQTVMERLVESETLTELIKKTPDFVKRELICLSLNAYHEARSSTDMDQIAASFVALNRMKANYRGANSICEVVWHWKQFSWTHDGKSDIPRNQTAWVRAQNLAFLVYNAKRFKLKDPTRGKLHYVRHDIVDRVWWAKNATEHQRIGAHVYMTLASTK